MKGKKKLQSLRDTECIRQESKIIGKKYEPSDTKLSKNSDRSEETMIISGFDDDEPNKEAVIKINKKKSKAPNKKIIEKKKIESDIEEVIKKRKRKIFVKID